MPHTPSVSANTVADAAYGRGVQLSGLGGEGAVAAVELAVEPEGHGYRDGRTRHLSQVLGVQHQEEARLGGACTHIMVGQCECYRYSGVNI